jgi:hypothetical protein
MEAAMIEKSEARSQKSEGPPITQLPINNSEALAAKLLDRLQAAFGSNVGLTTELRRLPMARGSLYLDILIQTHFKLSPQVTSDAINASRTVSDLAEKIAEAKGLGTPSLFSAPKPCEESQGQTAQR